MTQNEKKYDIFISYRHDPNTKVMALLLRTELIRCGFTVFVDLVEWNIGRFDERIENAIRSAHVFLFLYTPNCLARCNDEDDWVAKEIKTAQKSPCEIVPLNMDRAESTYTFPPKGLPQDIKKALERHQFISIPIDEYYVNAIEALQSGIKELMPFINGHEYVDLGLSVKWATCNVGASRPEDYGDYFAWGETKPKSEYTEKNSATYGELSIGNIAGDCRYDAARANWGDSWRLPTKEEIEELLANCDHEWTRQNGVKGSLFTSKKNGKRIFLPAVGYRYGSSLSRAGEYGNFWSASPYGSGSYYAYNLYFYSGNADWSWDGRYIGFSVRPVTE